MNELHEVWSARWRNILNVPLQEDAPDIREDFSLQSALWKADEGNLRQCFSQFPGGDLILKRALEAWQFTPVRAAVDDQFLLDLLEKMEKDTETVLRRASLDLSEHMERKVSSDGNRAVYRGDNMLRHKLFEDAFAPTFYLDEFFLDLVETVLGSEAVEAYLFLKEPLYMITSYQSIVYWIFWGALSQEIETDPYAHDFDLYKICAQAGWTESEMFVFLESD